MMVGGLYGQGRQIGGRELLRTISCADAPARYGDEGFVLATEKREWGCMVDLEMGLSELLWIMKGSKELDRSNGFVEVEVDE